MLWLIRHGESLSNAGAVTSDYAQMELTPRGHEQAERIAADFHEPPSRIVLSSYRRARQTADPLRRRFPQTPIVEAPVQEFTYQNPARFRGVCREERQPAVESYWQRLDPTYRDEEQAESFADLAQRVTTFLDQARLWDGWTVVFTHGNFMRAVVLASLLGSLPASAEAMRGLSSLRHGLTVDNGARLTLQHRDRRWWLGGLVNP